MSIMISDTDRDFLQKKLIYRSWHRGCKETDILLGEYAKKHVPLFNNDELALYKEFVEESDWDIYGWVTDSQKVPDKYLGLIDKIKNFQNSF